MHDFLIFNVFQLSHHLKAVDNTLISNKNTDNVSRAAIPDEELAFI